MQNENSSGLLACTSGVLLKLIDLKIFNQKSSMKLDSILVNEFETKKMEGGVEITNSIINSSLNHILGSSIPSL